MVSFIVVSVSVRASITRLYKEQNRSWIEQQGHMSDPDVVIFLFTFCSHSCFHRACPFFRWLRAIRLFCGVFGHTLGGTTNLTRSERSFLGYGLTTVCAIWATSYGGHGITLDRHEWWEMFWLCARYLTPARAWALCLEFLPLNVLSYVIYPVVEVFGSLNWAFVCLQPLAAAAASGQPNMLPLAEVVVAWEGASGMDSSCGVSWHRRWLMSVYGTVTYVDNVHICLHLLAVSEIYLIYLSFFHLSIYNLIHTAPVLMCDGAQA